MKKISHYLTKNKYLREAEHAIFLTHFDSVLKEKNIVSLEDKSYVHALIKYPDKWPETLDIFRFFNPLAVKGLQEKSCYFIFDASAEGFSPFEHQWFDILYYSCETHNINPQQIIFVSSNLRDDSNINRYVTQHNKVPINVFTFPMFEDSCSASEDVEKLLSDSINSTHKLFKNKFYSSLSRLNRYHRSVGTFLLCQTPVKEFGLISHDYLNFSNTNFSEVTQNTKYTDKHVKRWTKTLPLVVDYQDFETNWAIDRQYDHIHHQTIFQIVNETLVDNVDGTSLFYSEKTFRPISCFQPFIIYGQTGCNHYLENLGYKLYSDWFDLSFDFEEDYIKRYQKLLSVVEDTCKQLTNMDKKQQIAWKYKNQEVLIHNINTMNSHAYTTKKLLDFLEVLENQTVEHSK